MVDEGSNSMEQGNSVFTIWILQQMKNASFISFSTSFSATKTNTQLQASLRPNSLHFPKVRMHQKQFPQRSHPEARGPRPENTHVLCDVRWYVVVFGNHYVFGDGVCCGIVTRRNDVAASESLHATVFLDFETGWHINGFFCHGEETGLVSVMQRKGRYIYITNMHVVLQWLGKWFLMLYSFNFILLTHHFLDFCWSKIVWQSRAIFTQARSH